MKKVKWKNVGKFILFMFCMSQILSDMYLVIFKSYCFTWFGLLVFILFSYCVVKLYEDLESQTKSIPSYRPKHAKDTGVNND